MALVAAFLKLSKLASLLFRVLWHKTQKRQSNFIFDILNFEIWRKKLARSEKWKYTTSCRGGGTKKMFPATTKLFYLYMIADIWAAFLFAVSKNVKHLYD